jgi:hypothetical protein
MIGNMAYRVEQMTAAGRAIVMTAYAAIWLALWFVA